MPTRVFETSCYIVLTLKAHVFPDSVVSGDLLFLAPWLFQFEDGKMVAQLQLPQPNALPGQTPKALPSRRQPARRRSESQASQASQSSGASRASRASRARSRGSRSSSRSSDRSEKSSGDSAEGCDACPNRSSTLSRTWLTTAPWTKNILAVWHTYLLCVAACAIACASLVIVLFWHVEWYHHYDPSSSDLDFTLRFLAAFVKSWLLIGTTSELLRFCYLMSVDAWRTEMFEAYRRAMCFASFAEIAAGRLYVCGWPAPIKSWRKVADLILQFVIHVSLDILPVVMVVIDLVTWKNNFQLSSAMLAIACIHVVLFGLLGLLGI